jgi:hypothetical protein
MYLTMEIMNIGTECLALLLHIHDIPDSDLSPETGYPNWDFGSFPQFFQANAYIVS